MAEDGKSQSVIAVSALYSVCVCAEGNTQDGSAIGVVPSLRRHSHGSR